MTMHLYLLQPDIVFAAQVNMATVSYPIAYVDYDTISSGSLLDVEPGMTVFLGSSAGAHDYGIGYVRKTPAGGRIYVGWSSRGARIGEFDVVDNTYIAVLRDFRPWAIAGRITEDGTLYKGYDMPLGDFGSQPPPVANAGAAMAGTIDSGTGVLRVQLPDTGSNTSFAVADGASISSYEWDLPPGMALVSGYASTDAVIEVDVDPGFYYAALTVTDSNGHTHSARVPVYARDPAADTTIAAFEVTRHSIRPQGQDVALVVREDIPEATTPDGTLALLWEGEPAAPDDRSHMVFMGWHQSDMQRAATERSGLLRDVELTFLDVAGKLATLPGFPQSVEASASPATWYQMTAPNMDKYIHYLLQWHSNALELADYTPSGTGPAYPFILLSSDGDSLYEQVNRRAGALVPDYNLTCDRHGRLAVQPDPMLQDSGDRTSTVQATLDEGDWTSVELLHQPQPTTYWLNGNAIVASASAIEAIFCRAPGDAPGQGLSATSHGEQLARSQAALNACEGHRYARLNAPEAPLTIRLAGGDDRGIEPADMTWVRLTMSGDAASRRGLSFTNERGLVQELRIGYRHERTGLVKDIELIWERETVGTPAVTVIVPEDAVEDYGDWYPDWDPIPFDPLPEGDSGDLPVLDVTQSPAMYLLCRDVIARTRPNAWGGGSPQWEALLWASDYGSVDWRWMALDPWDPKGAMYLLQGGDGGPMYTRYVEALNAAAGAQSVSLVHSTGGNSAPAILRAAIDRQGTVAWLSENLGTLTDTHIYLRPGYTDPWRFAYTDENSGDRPYGLAFGTKGTQTAYAGVFGRKVFKTTNLGTSWSMLVQLPGTNDWLNPLIQVPYAGNPADSLFYAAMPSDSNLYYWNGSSVETRPIGYPVIFRGETAYEHTADVLHLATFNADRLAVLVEDGSDIKLATTDDGGSTWSLGAAITGGQYNPLNPVQWPESVYGWPWNENFFIVCGSHYGGAVNQYYQQGLLMTYDAGGTFTDLKGDWDTSIGAAYWDPKQVAIVWVA